jgi:hypothetical protein
MLIVLAGCASAGTNFDQSKADQLQPGVSTRADAERSLGKPNNETFNTDSTVILTWMHSTGTAWGTGKSRYVSILFRKDGTMLRMLQRGRTNVQ